MTKHVGGGVPYDRTINVKERIDKMRKLLTSMLTLTLVFGSVMTTQVVAEDNSGQVTQTKTIYVSYILEDGTPLPNAAEVVKIPVDAGNFNASLLKNVPAGYELAVSGDIAITGDAINVVVREAKKTIYVSYVLEDGTTLPNAIEQIKVAADAVNFNSSLLTKVPAGYELVRLGDYEIASDTINVTVRKAMKTVYVSYIDSKTKLPLENFIETIKIGAKETTFHSNILKSIPVGYKLANGVGDIYVGEGDSVNVEVTKLAENEKTVYVSYIDAETKMPLENAIEIIVLGPNDTTFNASILKEIPEGYELAQIGDIYIGNNDTVNVEVRKSTAKTKTVYVSYINEADKTPFENGIESITVKEDATYFNTSVLKKVPSGYELVLTGDIYFGKSDTINVEVRKVTTPSKPQGDNKPNTGASSNDKNHQKPVAAVATPLPGANYTYVVPNTATK